MNAIIAALSIALGIKGEKLKLDTRDEEKSTIERPRVSTPRPPNNKPEHPNIPRTVSFSMDRTNMSDATRTHSRDYVSDEDEE